MSLVVRRNRLSTVGDRAFPIASARLWNNLPSHVTTAPALSTFRSRLKHHLFSHSFPNFWLSFSRSVPSQRLDILDTLIVLTFTFLHLNPIHTTVTTDADATQLWSWVASASAVCTEFATSSRRLPTDSVVNLETEHSGLTTWILIDIDNFFDNDVIMSSPITNLNWSKAQEIVNWVTTADGCVRTTVGSLYWA